MIKLLYLSNMIFKNMVKKTICFWNYYNLYKCTLNSSKRDGNICFLIKVLMTRQIKKPKPSRRKDLKEQEESDGIGFAEKKWKDFLLSLDQYLDHYESMRSEGPWRYTMALSDNMTFCWSVN